MRHVHTTRFALCALLSATFATIAAASATIVIPISEDQSSSTGPVPSVADATPEVDVGGPFRGFRISRSLETGANGTLRAVASIHAIFDDPSVRVHAVTNASLLVLDGAFLHDGVELGMVHANKKLWAPQSTVEAHFDSFVTIGGPISPENLTVLDEAWDRADLRSPQGVGWSVRSFDARHGQPMPMADGDFGVLVARLATAPGCMPLDSEADSDGATVAFAGTILWTSEGISHRATDGASDVVAAIEGIAGDLNCDGTVDGSDLKLLLQSWLQAEAASGSAQDASALGLLLANWMSGAI